MSKRVRRFDRIAEFKQRLGNLPTARLRERLNFGFLQKEAAIAIRELLEDRGETLAPTQTIYIALLEEGVDVWRPVEATALPNGLFRIVSENADSETEIWQFQTGAVVRCEQRIFADGKEGLVAVESPAYSA
jgi:hypothetical protein